MFPTFFISENIIASDTILVLSRNPRITYYKDRLISYRIFGIFSDFVLQTCIIEDGEVLYQAQNTPILPAFTSFPMLLISHSPQCPAHHYKLPFHNMQLRCHQENWENTPVTDICPRSLIY